MCLHFCVKLEWYAIQEHHATVIGTGGCPNGTLLTNRNGINDRRMTTHFSYGIAAVRRYTMPKPLSPITDCNNALRISIPGNVIYSARDDVVLALGDS
jgi:hypothetical protein